MLAYACALLERVKADRKGVTALEYGVLAGVLVVAIGLAATALSTGLSTKFAALVTAL